MRLTHCTPGVLTPEISPNVGNSTASFVVVGTVFMLSPVIKKKKEKENATAFVDQTNAIVRTRENHLNLGGNKEDRGKGHARDTSETWELVFSPLGKRLTLGPH